MQDFRVLLLDEQGKTRAASEHGLNYIDAGQLARWIENGGHAARIVPNERRFDSPKVLKFYTPTLVTAPGAVMPEVNTWADEQVQTEFPIADQDPAAVEAPSTPAMSRQRTWWQWAFSAITWALVVGAWLFVTHSVASVAARGR